MPVVPWPHVKVLLADNCTPCYFFAKTSKHKIHCRVISFFLSKRPTMVGMDFYFPALNVCHLAMTLDIANMINTKMLIIPNNFELFF